MKNVQQRHCKIKCYQKPWQKPDSIEIRLNILNACMLHSVYSLFYSLAHVCISFVFIEIASDDDSYINRANNKSYLVKHYILHHLYYRKRNKWIIFSSYSSFTSLFNRTCTSVMEIRWMRKLVPWMKSSLNMKDHLEKMLIDLV